MPSFSAKISLKELMERDSQASKKVKRSLPETVASTSRAFAGDGFDLSEEQKFIFDQVLKERKSVFFTGSAGALLFLWNF